MAEWFEKRLDEIAEFNPRELLKKGSISKNHILVAQNFATETL